MCLPSPAHVCAVHAPAPVLRNGTHTVKPSGTEGGASRTNSMRFGITSVNEVTEAGENKCRDATRRWPRLALYRIRLTKYSRSPFAHRLQRLAVQTPSVGIDRQSVKAEDLLRRSPRAFSKYQQCVPFRITRRRFLTALGPRHISGPVQSSACMCSRIETMRADLQNFFSISKQTIDT